MIRHFRITCGKERQGVPEAKIFEPVFANYPLVPIFAVLFERSIQKVLKNSIKRS